MQSKLRTRIKIQNFKLRTRIKIQETPNSDTDPDPVHSKLRYKSGFGAHQAPDKNPDQVLSNV